MIKTLKYLFLMLLMIGAVIFFNGSMNSEEEDPDTFTIAFYNVENLFDTINDHTKNDDKFLPSSKVKWDSKRYWQKVHNLAKVIDQLGDSNGPEVIGLSEVENSSVLKDLIHSEYLKAKGYEFIQFDSKDKRGIDVAFLYKKNKFTLSKAIAKPVIRHDRKNFKTRDVLVVSGKVGKDSLYFLLNHWPSRLGGQEESEENRFSVAKHTRSILDSIFKISSKAKIIVMGDFNDEPSNLSITKELMAKELLNDCKIRDLYNPFFSIMKEGRGTIKYEGQWDLLDQIMVSKELLQGRQLKYKSNSADIYDPIWLYYKQNTKHGPYRTFVGSKYFGGYSDHFPVYIQLLIGH